MTEQEHKDAVYQSCKDNHIWLNAMSCINPTNEYCASLGRDIINKLNLRRDTIPAGPFEPEPTASAAFNAAAGHLAEQPMLFMSFNKS